MDEGRKRVIGVMAAILAARKLCQLESTRPSPALNSIIADAVIFGSCRGLIPSGPRDDAAWDTHMRMRPVRHQSHKSTPLLEETNRQNDDYYQYGNLNPIC